MLSVATTVIRSGGPSGRNAVPTRVTFTLPVVATPNNVLVLDAAVSMVYVRLSPASTSAAATVPITALVLAFLATLISTYAVANLGASGMSVSATVMVAVALAPARSRTMTVTEKVGCFSKSSAGVPPPDSVATTSAPVVFTMANGDCPLSVLSCDRMANVSTSPASTSAATTLPTAVPAAEFSGTLKLCADMVGGSLQSTTVTVTIAESVSLPPVPGSPLSVTVTVSAYDATVSKSSFVGLDTFSSPDSESMSNTPSALPPVMAYASVLPSGSLAATAGSTSVPMVAFSSTRRAAPGFTVGFSFRSPMVTVQFACDDRPPGSVTLMSSTTVGSASWSRL